MSLFDPGDRRTRQLLPIARMGFRPPRIVYDAEVVPVAQQDRAQDS